METVPIQVLEAHAEETGWNENSMLAICCDFIQQQGVENAAFREAFARYVAERAKEDFEASIDDGGRNA